MRFGNFPSSRKRRKVRGVTFTSLDNESQAVPVPVVGTDLEILDGPSHDPEVKDSFGQTLSYRRDPVSRKAED